ncbi:MAG: SIMPL domain-containing protein [Holosporaceae bacterium]|jgi:hypothetical protein|nr:SIMPL domain-containing protein [Holosporaceae bacterium]
MRRPYIIASIIISGGLIGFGYFSSKNMRAGNELIEVKGLSEKIVRADVGDMSIRISNTGKNLEELYKKRISDKDKVIGFVKSQGITEEEIVNSSMDTTEEYENEGEIISSGMKTVKKRRYFKAEDKLIVRTKDLSKINKIKEEIIKLSSEGIFITFHYSYSLTNFADIKLIMMRDASENAKKNAEACVAPHGQKIGKVVYLRQGEITIRAEDESENTDSWNSKESASVNKKLRLVVRAGFSKSFPFK